MPIELRDVTPADYPAMVDMNRAAISAVSEASLEDIAWFAGCHIVLAQLRSRCADLPGLQLYRQSSQFRYTDVVRARPAQRK